MHYGYGLLQLQPLHCLLVSCPVIRAFIPLLGCIVLEQWAKRLRLRHASHTGHASCETRRAVVGVRERAVRSVPKSMKHCRTRTTPDKVLGGIQLRSRTFLAGLPVTRRLPKPCHLCITVAWWLCDPSRGHLSVLQHPKRCLSRKWPSSTWEWLRHSHTTSPAEACIDWSRPRG